MEKYDTPQFLNRLANLNPQSTFFKKVMIRTETDQEKIAKYTPYEREIYEQWREYYYSEEELREMEIEKAKNLMNFLENRD